MQLKMTRFHGHLFLAPGRLYFVCLKEGGAWAAAIAGGLGGAVGMAIANAATGTNGNVSVPDEHQLRDIVSRYPGSLIMEAHQIQEIKQTIWMRLIRFNDNRYGLPKGLGKELKAAIGPWAKHHQVKTTGF